MALKKPKQPKYKAMPKAPSMKAGADAWKRYSQKADEVTKENLKKKSEYERALKAYESELKQREAIKAKVRNAKAKF